MFYFCKKKNLVTSQPSLAFVCGDCFCLQFYYFSCLQKETFHHLYSFYCQNKPASEELRRQVGDNNPFFVECQTKLSHKLPLGAYLLKPVQRITKYQLLLKVRGNIGTRVISRTTVSQDVQTRFPVQLAFAKFLSKIKGNF